VNITIDENLVRRLIAMQITQWQQLPIRLVVNGGWDNRTFHLGEQMLVRMPSAERYATKIEKEFKWLPILAPLLPLQIPQPIVMGEPGEGYPWHWSVYHWLEGDTVAVHQNVDLNALAKSLGEFLVALQSIDTTNGPLPGPHNFYRGGSLAVYDDEVRRALAILKDKIDTAAAIKIWETALATSWQKHPVWAHGDIAAGNLLVKNGQLSAVIDFGGLAIGDPACDLAIAWTLFEGESREAFCSTLALDSGTWERGRAWALWKALIIAAGISKTNAIEGERSWHIIDEIINEFKGKSSNENICCCKI
jgi:aminoglycoside phosphotransferase (APT) family kinase protein